MMILKKEYKMCTMCMEEHEVSLIEVEEENIFKGQNVRYKTLYEYCENTGEYFASEKLISQNDIAMKNAYREKMNLLSTEDIMKIREKYDISQMDFATLLGWGGKTITRYEGHHIQDAAHDSILRKINDDPEWFVNLLEQDKLKFSVSSYKRYRENALKLYEKYQDSYLRKSIEAQYAPFNGNEECCGNVKLDISKVIDVISYLANSDEVTNLFKVKLMKLLWYIDNFSFKKRGISITGLAYRALPMGAVPVAHKIIMELQGVEYEEVDFGEGVGYRFIKVPEAKYESLSKEDMLIIDKVIRVCGRSTKEEIVRKMHNEKAYVKTSFGEIIKYPYAKELILL